MIRIGIRKNYKIHYVEFDISNNEIKENIDKLIEFYDTRKKVESLLIGTISYLGPDMLETKFKDTTLNIVEQWKYKSICKRGDVNMIFSNNEWKAYINGNFKIELLKLDDYRILVYLLNFSLNKDSIFYDIFL